MFGRPHRTQTHDQKHCWFDFGSSTVILEYFVSSWKKNNVGMLLINVWPHSLVLDVLDHDMWGKTSTHGSQRSDFKGAEKGQHFCPESLTATCWFVGRGYDTAALAQNLRKSHDILGKWHGKATDKWSQESFTVVLNLMYLTFEIIIVHVFTPHKVWVLNSLAFSLKSASFW